MVCLAPQISVKALQSVFPQVCPPGKKKKKPTQGKIVPELTVLIYQDEILGTWCENLSLTKRKSADVVNVQYSLNTENKAA